MPRHTTPPNGRVQRPRAIGYVRVSSVGGRAGDSFISPDVQRDTITAKAAERGAKIVDWHTDLDESGGKYDRPGFQSTLAAIETGAADVVIVARLTRFARSVLDTHRALERIEAAGGRLIACDLDVDTSSATGRMIRNVLAVLAEFELDLSREQWDTAKGRAIARGVSIGPAPFGYRLTPERKLEPDPVTAPVLQAVFEGRAAGASLGELGEKIRAVTGQWCRESTVAGMLRNDVYLGRLQFGRFVNESAHTGLVDPVTFDAVQQRFRKGVAHDQRVRSLLAGLAKCPGCGRGLALDTGGPRRQKSYRCVSRRDCPAPVSIMASNLDAFVSDTILEWAEPVLDTEVVVELGGAADLDRRIAEAEQALESYVTHPDQFGLDDRIFEAGIAARRAAVDELRGERDQLGPAAAIDVIRTTLREEWPGLDTSERRRLLSAVIDRIDVLPATRRMQPARERVAILLRDGTSLHDPTQLVGERGV